MSCATSVEEAVCHVIVVCHVICVEEWCHRKVCGGVGV